MLSEASGAVLRTRGHESGRPRQMIQAAKNATAKHIRRTRIPAGSASPQGQKRAQPRGLRRPVVYDPRLNDRNEHSIVDKKHVFRKRAAMLNMFAQHRANMHDVAQGELRAVSLQMALRERLWRELKEHSWKDELASQSEEGQSLDDFERTLPEQAKLLIHPKASWKIRWDMLVGVCILYSCLLVPYYLAFTASLKGSGYWFDFSVSMVFWADLLVTFRTAIVEDDGGIIVDGREIAWRYLKGWFSIDFLSNFPFEDFIALVSSSQNSTLASTSLLRILRLSRLIRLSRLLKLTKMLGKIENEIEISPALIGLTKLTLQLTMIGHYLACVWMSLTLIHNQSGMGGITWLEKWGLQDASPSHQYIAALYYSFTTMSTVGYGDITPENSLEWGFAIFAELLGATVFGYIVGNVSVLMEGIDFSTTLFREKLDRVKEYCYRNKSVYNIDDYVEELPSACGTALVIAQYKPLIQCFSFLKLSSPSFVADFVRVMRPCFIYKGELVMCEGEVGSAMFFIKKGQVNLLCVASSGKKEPDPNESKSVCLETHTPRSIKEASMTVGLESVVNSAIDDTEFDPDLKLIKVSTLRQDSFFGEPPLLFSILQPCSAVTTTHSEFCFVSREDLSQVLHAWPDVREKLKAHSSRFLELIGALKLAWASENSKAKSAHDIEPIASELPPVPEIVQEGTPNLTSSNTWTQPGEHKYNAAGDWELRRENSVFSASITTLVNEAATTTPSTLWKQKRLVHPDSSMKAVWDVFVCCLIMYSILLVTYRLGFNETPSAAAAIFDYFVDATFFFDIVITFRTAYCDENGSLVSSSSAIWKRYLKGWFAIDVVSTVPFDTVLGAIVSNSAALRSTKLLRAIRLARLVKIARLLKLSRFFMAYEDDISIHPSVLRVAHLLVLVIFVAHLSSCLFYAISANTQATSKWIDEYCVLMMADGADYTCVNHLPSGQKYLITLYWAFTTMTTVGYGDITPSKTSIPEMLMAIISIIAGSMLFAYVIGAVVGVVLNLDPAGKIRKERFGYLHDCMQDAGLSKSSSKSVKRQVSFQMQARSALDEKSILMDFPPHLVNSIHLFVLRSHIPKLSLLCILEHRLPGSMSVVLPFLKPAYYMKGDTIMNPRLCSRELFFFLSGSADVIRLSDMESWLRVGCWDCIGEHVILLDELKPFRLLNEVRANSTCQVMILNKSALTQLEIGYSEVFSSLEALLRQLYQKHGQDNEWVLLLNTDQTPDRQSSVESDEQIRITRASTSPIGEA